MYIMGMGNNKNMGKFNYIAPKKGSPCVGVSTQSFCDGKCIVAATRRAYIMYVAERKGLFTLVSCPVDNYKEGSIRVLSSVSKPGVLCLQHVHSDGATVIGYVQPVEDGIIFTAGNSATAAPVRISFNFKSYCRLRRKGKDKGKDEKKAKSAKAPKAAKAAKTPKARKPKQAVASVEMRADNNVQTA